jgi:hypothetical protein
MFVFETGVSRYSLAVSAIAVSNRQLIWRSAQFGVVHAAVRFMAPLRRLKSLRARQLTG